DQYALAGADHGGADRARLRVELRLQAREPLLLHLGCDLIGERRRRRARAAAVEEAEGLVEADVAHEVERRLEVLLPLPGKAADETRRQADVGARRAQAAHLLLELERGVAALHERQHPVRAALRGQVQVARELADIRERLDQAVVELERVRGGEADALDA